MVPMVREFVLDQVIRAMSDVQRNAGRDVPVITEEMIPFRDISGFDSLSGVETAVILSQGLAVEIDSIAFVTLNIGAPKTVREIVDSVIREYGAKIVSSSSFASSKASA